MSLIFLSVLFSGHQITTFAAPQSRSRPVVRTAQCSHPDGRCCQSKVLTCSSGAMQHYKAKAPQDTSMLSQSQQRSYLRFSILPKGTSACCPGIEPATYQLQDNGSTPEPQPSEQLEVSKLRQLWILVYFFCIITWLSVHPCPGFFKHCTFKSSRKYNPQNCWITTVISFHWGNLWAIES